MINVTEVDKELYNLWSKQGNYIYQLAEALVKDEELRKQTIKLLEDI